MMSRVSQLPTTDCNRKETNSLPYGYCRPEIYKNFRSKYQDAHYVHDVPDEPQGIAGFTLPSVRPKAARMMATAAADPASLAMPSRKLATHMIPRSFFTARMRR